MEYTQIIQRPLVTEKALSGQGEGGRYAFVVDRRATKGAIRAAVEHLFKVKVAQVNTAIVRGKIKRVGRNAGKRPNWKKALITLKPGNKIELFEGV